LRRFSGVPCRGERAIVLAATVFAASALAALSPLPAPQAAYGAIARLSAIDLGPAGVTRKADYFCARQRRDSVQRIFPCRFHLRAAERLHGFVQVCD
jgi:hypothetical protein